MSDLPPPALEARFLEPAGFQWGHFTSSRGAVLRWGHLPAAGGRTCIVVGGFGEFVEKYFETLRDLAARGFSVWFLDWAGQGGSARPAGDPTRPLARDFEKDADDLAQFAQKVVSGEAPRLLVAHSMGGAIGLLCLARHPKLFAAAVLSAPMLRLKLGPLPEGLARFIANAAVAFGGAGAFAPGAGRWKADPDLTPARSHISNDPARCLVLREWYTARPALQVDGATYGWLQSSLRLIERLADQDLLASVNTPVIIGSAGRDQLVDPEQHKRTAAALPRGALISYPDAKHELFMEVDAVRAPWLGTIDAFARDHLR